jgi:hypothetical protein
MKPTIAFYMVLVVAAAVIGGKSWIPAAEDSGHDNKTSTSRKIETEQVPTWSDHDMDFFLHGSMSTEVIRAAAADSPGGTGAEISPRFARIR